MADPLVSRLVDMEHLRRHKGNHDIESVVGAIGHVSVAQLMIAVRRRGMAPG